MESPGVLLKTYAALPIRVDRGEGVWLHGDRRYLDLYAGHAVASTGHAHPRVIEAIAEQARRLTFFSTSVDLDVRRRAAAMLGAKAPLKHVLFLNSGAEAIENALRMARRHTGRANVVAMEGGFHGRTAGAISVTGIEKFRKLGAPNVPGASFVPFGDAAALERAVDRETAAVLLEPIQSMAGVRVPPAGFLRAAREITAKAGAMLIYDEVQTGIGRTGEWFVAGRDGIVPDLVALGKGIASGLPCAAVLVSDAIAANVNYGDYGSTFGGGPVVMAAVCATLEVIEGERLLENVRRVSAWIRERLPVRGEGFLLGVRTSRPTKDVQKELIEKGVVVGTSDDPNVVRLLPPLVLRVEDLASVWSVIHETLR